MAIRLLWRHGAGVAAGLAFDQGEVEQGQARGPWPVPARLRSSATPTATRQVAGFRTRYLAGRVGHGLMTAMWPASVTADAVGRVAERTEAAPWSSTVA